MISDTVVLAVRSGFYKVVNRRYQPSHFWPVEVPGKDFLTERLETYVVDPESGLEAEHWLTTSRRGRLFKADATTSRRAREIAEEDPAYPREWLEDRQRLTGIDVSASQLQILAVLLGLKEIEATLVKAPFKEVFAEEICRRHRDQDDAFTLLDWNDPDPGDPKLKEAGKVAVMTYLYGSEPRQIAHRLRNARSRFGPGLGDAENVTHLLTGSEIVREIMTVFRPACEALVDEAYRRDPYAGIRLTDPYDHSRVRWNPIRWTNGKVVRQKLTIFFRKPVGTPNRAEDYPVDYGTLKRPGKFRRMVRPTLIHMLDALFASLVVEELHERGVRDVVSVHDAWMVAADAEGELRSAFEAAGGPWLRALEPVYDDFIDYLRHDPKYGPWAVALKAKWKGRVAKKDWPNFYAAATPLVEDDWR
jgi:hypothetical protein